MAIKRNATKQSQFGLFCPPSAMTLEQKETKKQHSFKTPRRRGKGRRGSGLQARRGRQAVGRETRSGGEVGLAAGRGDSVGESVVDDFLNLAGRHGRGLGRSQQAGGAASATCETETRSSLPFSKFPRMTLFDDQRSAPFKDMRVIVGSTHTHRR